MPAASTLVVGTWAPIPNIVFGPEADLRIAGANDDDTTAKAVDYLSNGNPDSTFVHLDEVDGAGHSSGADSEAYRAAMRRVDSQVGELLDAVEQRPTYPNENWLIAVTADHGHTPTGGHGGNTPGERQVFIIAKGAGIPAGSVRHDIKSVDIAPSVLSHSEVTVRDDWNLDGKPFATITPDAFDGLRSALKSRVDETSLPADIKGWTGTPPAGWSIDNSAMPAGGVTEWRGWSFATDEFWSNTQRGQGRETSVRNRNVFAVADSDEWDDKAHGAGQFNSTLISPRFAVPAGGKAVLSYATNYRIDGPQTGDVLVSFDGAQPKLLKSYRSTVNGFEKIELTAPAGATGARIHFWYTGTNSAFWTVDQVSVK